jgi:chorismate synthase
MLRFLTAGESHGPALLATLDGIPAGLELTTADIDPDLRRRQQGYGRGGRMKIERDQVEILGGVRHGRTIGSPIALRVANRDWENWQEAMAVGPVAIDDAAKKRLTRPRPGHADLAGSLKHNADDARDILERASARETTMRVAIGAICRKFLAAFDVAVASHTVGLGDLALPAEPEIPWDRVVAAEGSPLRCADAGMEQKMIAAIDAAKAGRDSIGGIFQVVARGVPAGLGSHRHWDLRLSARLAGAICSIPSVKAAAVGDGVEGARAAGSAFHDEIFYDGADRRFYRRTNRAGGVEGGMTNGEEIRVRGYVKPLSTLPRPLHSVDLKSKQEFQAQVERTDVCAIAAAGVVGEAMVAFVLAQAFLEKFGGDSLGETRRNHAGYLEQLRAY